jgi:hypothetical protein
MSTHNQILETIKSFNKEQQFKLLEFIKSIKPAKRNSGKDLLKFVGKIPKSDLKIMQSSINEGCENIDKNEW